MCGIAGYYGFRKDEVITKMSQDLKHRGPDGEGFYLADSISLLNRRLSIIDREGGGQPIYNEDKSLVVVFNGEIFNYLELKEELESKGHIFSTKSDTEVILHGYEEWGYSCFDRFNGMFGIALYDIKNKKLILARDHFGIKPLYFAKIIDKPLKIIFSSEIKPILNSNLINKEVNERILYRYLKHRIHDDQRETFFNGIERLLPGELAIIQDQDITFQTFSSIYNDFEKSLNPQNYQSFGIQEIQRFRELLTKSIKDRLMSEVPVGTALSGGLDSSTVVAVINKLLKDNAVESNSVGVKQNTFSAVFPGSSNNEEKYIDSLLTKSESITSHKIYPTPEEFFQDLEDFVKTQEEPTISTGPYAQYQVMKEASKHVTVLLDGQGADEMMAGYLPYYFVYLKELQKSKDYFNLISEVWGSKDIIFKFLMLKIFQKLGIQKPLAVSSLLNSDFNNKFQQEKFEVVSDNLKKRLWEDLFKNSLPSLLRYEDRNTMRFSVEGRVPFLDFNLLRFLLNLPNKAIIQQGWNKYILRESVKDLLPHEIYKRRNKIGFTTPEYDWFLKMKNRIYQIFMSETFAKRPYFNQTQIVQAFREFIEGKNTDTMLFWRFLNVELWLREFFDEKKESKNQTEWKFGLPNEGKNLEINVEEISYQRLPLKTSLLDRETDIIDFVVRNIQNHLPHDFEFKNKWYLIVSEKVVAISQGRSFFIWDIKPSFWAKILSKFVRRTPHGIGLGSPWTMQIAIDEAGLPLILWASFCSIVTKPFGIKGIFYQVVGHQISAIDGPTEYSVYPSNVSAKLAPKNPQGVSEKLSQEISKVLSKEHQESFGGVVIIDANDLGTNVLGNSTTLSNKFFENCFRDNPLGQSNEQTPLAILTQS